MDYKLSSFPKVFSNSSDKIKSFSRSRSHLFPLRNYSQISLISTPSLPVSSVPFVPFVPKGTKGTVSRDVVKRMTVTRHTNETYQEINRFIQNKNTRELSFQGVAALLKKKIMFSSKLPGFKNKKLPRKFVPLKKKNYLTHIESTISSQINNQISFRLLNINEAFKSASIVAFIIARKLERRASVNLL